jgi:hypothetical protein
VIESFIGWVWSSGSPSGTSGPSWVNVAAAPLTVTESTVSGWKSNENRERFWVAVAVIVVVAESKLFSPRSYSSSMS